MWNYKNIPEFGDFYKIWKIFLFKYYTAPYYIALFEMRTFKIIADSGGDRHLGNYTLYADLWSKVDGK